MTRDEYTPDVLGAPDSMNGVSYAEKVPRMVV